jgi:hypothetical protein
MMLMSPALALGQAVHSVVESLSVVPVDKRFERPLVDLLEEQWRDVTGKRGGFFDDATEQQYKERGRQMVRRAQEHPGPLSKLAVKLASDLPNFELSKEDNIILCGRIDWLQYSQETNSVHIIDFKTGRNEENVDSLQLPIYVLLTHYTQDRPIDGVSYWYLDSDDAPVAQPMPDLKESQEKILTIAKQIKLARALERFKCPRGEQGCGFCRPYEAIYRGEAELVYSKKDWKQDVYVLPRDGGGKRETGTVL